MDRMDKAALEDFEHGACPLCGARVPGEDEPAPVVALAVRALQWMVDGFERDPFAMALAVTLSLHPELRQEQVAGRYGVRRQLVAAGIPRAKELAPWLGEMIAKARKAASVEERKRLERAHRRAYRLPPSGGGGVK